MTGLHVEGLSVQRGATVVLDRVELHVAPGETVALVGESGAGKTTLIQAVLGTLSATARVTAGEVRIDGVRSDSLSPRRHERLRLTSVGYVPQEAGSALDPLRRLEQQLDERLRLAHVPADQRVKRGTELLRRAGIPDPERVRPLYPHQISGGYRQRVLLAIALAGDPAVVLADEATSALDPSTRDEVLDQLAEYARAREAATLLVTHDLGVATRRADRVAILQHGRVIEVVRADGILTASDLHPSTRALLDASLELNPRPATPPVVLDAPKSDIPAVLELRNVTRRFPDGTVGADSVTLRVDRATTTGLVGRSGSGKTTIVRLALGLDTPTSGDVVWDGDPIRRLAAKELRRRRRRIQYVAQDPWDSLDPRQSVGRIIAEPVVARHDTTRRQRRALVVEALDLVQLPSTFRRRLPHELSGGQQQRIAIARALITRPDVIVLDEPTAALDTITQARLLDLLSDLQAHSGVSYLLISHDVAAVRRLAHRIVSLEHGRVVGVEDAIVPVFATRSPGRIGGAGRAGY